MCSHPKVLKNGQLVPCGKCISCKNKRVSDWSTRMFLEANSHGFNNCSFITLTYNDANLPVNACLSKRDLQLFFKRLRKFLPIEYKIKYFASGEYGSKFGRPHYHAIIFGLPYSIAEFYVKKAWKLGFICVKQVSSHSFRYVAKYCVKEYGKTGFDCFTGELISEFVTMSRRCGIGFCALDDHKNYNEETGEFQIKRKGKVLSIPKALKQRLKIRRGLKIYVRNDWYLKDKEKKPFEVAVSIGLDPFKYKLKEIEVHSFSDLDKELQEASQRELNYLKCNSGAFFKFYRDNHLEVNSNFYIFSRFFDYLFF